MIGLMKPKPEALPTGTDKLSAPVVEIFRRPGNIPIFLQARQDIFGLAFSVSIYLPVRKCCLFYRCPIVE